MKRLCTIVILSLCAVSCGVELRRLPIESVSLEAVGDEVTSIITTTSGAKEVNINSAEIVINLNGEPLISATLKRALSLGAEQQREVVGLWSIEKHDPATLYAMSRRPIESYAKRLSLDYMIEIEGQRLISRRGVKGKRLTSRFLNSENLLSL